MHAIVAACTGQLRIPVLNLNFWGGGVLPYMGYKCICHCEGYRFQQFSLGQGIEISRFWFRIGYHLWEIDQWYKDGSFWFIVSLG